MIPEQDLMKNILQAILPGVTIYLFGSRARGTHRPESDIDIALDAGRQLSLTELARAQRLLDALHVPQKIEVVDVGLSSDSFRKTVFSEGNIAKK